MGFGSMRWPRRKSLRVVMASGVSVDGRELSAAALPGLPDDGDRVTRGIGRVEQIQVGCRDLSFPGDPIAQPVRHPHPVRPAEQNHGKVTDLAGLDQSEEHTSELQSPIDNSYAVFCLKKKKSVAAASTTPPPDARTGVPAGTAMSIPWCDSFFFPGSRRPRVTKRRLTLFPYTALFR